MKLLANSCQEVREDHPSPLTMAWQRVFMQINNVATEEQTRTRQTNTALPQAWLIAEQRATPCSQTGPQAEGMLASPCAKGTQFGTSGGTLIARNCAAGQHRKEKIISVPKGQLISELLFRNWLKTLSI